jgi:sRNA-binding carbon storage regulator CsrA
MAMMCFCEAKCNRISLGIVAPSDVKILCGELNQPKANAQTVELIVEDGLLVAC